MPMSPPGGSFPYVVIFVVGLIGGCTASDRGGPSVKVFPLTSC